MSTMDLSKYNNSEYNTGSGVFKRIAWYLTNAVLFNSWLMPFSGVKTRVLQLFGCDLGEGVIIKPRVNIKYPWKVKIGDHVWIGEGVWIDSLDMITIGSNVCVSQGAYLLTGNHDYKDPHFGLITKPIVIQDGAWVGAKVVVCPGSVMYRNSIVTAGSVFTGESIKDGIYQGNPAVLIRERKIAFR